MIVVEKPIYHPYVCIICGKNTGEYFVDLGVHMDYYFNPAFEGSIYYCNECWNSLVAEATRQIQNFQFGKINWGNDEYVKPEFTNTKELIVGNIRTTNSRAGVVIATIPESTEGDRSTAEDDRDVTGDGSETQSDDSNSEPTELRDFNLFFGGENKGG